MEAAGDPLPDDAVVPGESHGNAAEAARRDEPMTCEDDGEEDDSDDEDDDESGDEGVAAQRVVELECSLKENPYAYESHIQLIQACREAGDLGKLRESRKAMSAIYPLTEELWMEWLQDELSLVADSGDRDHVEALFQQAVSDYLSVPIWVELCTFMIGRMGEENGLNKVRQTFEAAVNAAGLHCSKGALIWEAYREFEAAILAGLQPAIGAVTSTEQQHDIEKQTERIVSIFVRQLAIPLIGMEKTLDEYKSWIGEDLSANAKLELTAAQNKLAELLTFEEAIENAEDAASKAAVYRKLIDKERLDGKPERICCTYERAIAEGGSLTADLWYEYGLYCEKQYKDDPKILKTYERALRNCPWSSSLWSSYVKAMEKQSQPHQVVLEAFEKALQSGFHQQSDYLEVWSAYCDYLRRHIDWQSDHTDSLALLRQTFERAINYLLEYFGEEADASCSLPKYWALIEAKYCKDIDRARQIWNDVMAGSNAGSAQMWLDYMAFERAFGDVKHCRKVAQRAMKAVSDWPESICNAYLTFEREEGTLDHYYIALSRVKERRDKDKLQKEKEKAAMAADTKKSNKKPKQAKPLSAQPVQGKRGGHAAQARTADVSKPGVLAAGDGERDVTADEPALRSPGQLPEPIPARPASHEMNTMQDGAFKVPNMPSTVPKRPSQCGDAEPPSKKPKAGSPDTDQADTARNMYSVFVSNLDYSVTEDAVKNVLSQAGEITEVRLIKKHSGQSKGYGYVEFASREAVDKALQLDRTPINGRPTFVARCDPERRGQTKLKFSTGLEKNKLFVRGLPFTLTKEDLEKIFVEHGKLKDIRIVTYRNGHSKGLAYVEYEREADAAQAVLKTDGQDIDGRTISVAISNPPPHNDVTKSDSTAFVKSLGGGSRQSSSGRAGARTQLSMVPRSLLNEAGKANSKADQSPASQQLKTKLTNTDFRQMLLK